MGDYGPFDVRAGCLQRSPHLVDIIVRNRPGTSAYRLWGAKTLNDAYGTVVDSGLTGTGGTALLTATANTMAQSNRIVRRGATVAEVRRGQTSFQFDIDDFITPAVPPPFGPDDDMMFLRIQEQRAGAWLAVPAGAVKNANYPIRGPILVLPNASFYGSMSASLAVYGTAPKASDCVAGAAPVFDPTVQKPLPLHLVFPRPATSLIVRNLSGSKTMLVAFGLGQPMITVAANGEIASSGGGWPPCDVRELILATADDTAPNFFASAVVTHGG